MLVFDNYSFWNECRNEWGRTVMRKGRLESGNGKQELGNCDPSGKRLTDQNGNQAMGWYGLVDAYAVFKVPSCNKKTFGPVLL